MGIRLYTEKRRSLKAEVGMEHNDFHLSGSMEIIDGRSTDYMKVVHVRLGDYHLEIDHEELAAMYKFMTDKR